MNLIDFTEMGQVDSPGWKECDVRVAKAVREPWNE